ncbi:glycosyltransferase [Flavobacterium johnsoniae]|uniref:glycosyltransferase n=1 Tax=Flavobacterium johnsoniae TaxID=986 RepID=UPI0025B18C75|nr:glycosyltransferase [Flavobacterium johnsoniae]WJS94215.1 glycosyltransferase [Flavobacterium johnsoniae]
MKVIHYIASIDKSGGGTTEYIRLLSKELKEDTTFSIATGVSKDPISIEGVPVKFFNNKISRWFSLINEYRIFLKNEAPDIVHINGIWTPQNWVFQNEAQKLGIKVIVSPHGMLEPWIMAHNPIKKKIALLLYQKTALKRSICLHATAKMEAENIQALGFKNPIHIIPNGIHLKDVKKIKENYGTKKMIFMSRIHPKKGIELLLDAWRTSNTEDWTLEIAGSGEQEYIESLLQSTQDLKNVHFVGAKYGEEKWDFLRSADVMVLPTHSENFGIVVAEALAVAVPVITTHGTPWEDLEIHKCGWWIDLSVANLEKALFKVFNSPTMLLEMMGKHGRDLVISKYDMKNVGKKMLELYKTV